MMIDGYAETDRKLGALIAMMRSNHQVTRRTRPDTWDEEFLNKNGVVMIRFTVEEIIFAIGQTAFERMIEGIPVYEEEGV